MELVVVFFVYGLAFFSMGLAMAFEAGRSPSLAEARVLRPLAVFGLLHGAHEWLEIFIVQAEYFGVEIPLPWLWLRLGLLVLSFVSLIAYGVQVLRPPEHLSAMDLSIGGGLLTLYIALVLLTGAIFWQNVNEWINWADVLARYTLAIPGAALASLALRRQANQASNVGRVRLPKSLYWASAGFMIYALTQVFVTPVDMFPANVVNVDLFTGIFHVPIQVLRAGIAVLITISLIRSTQIVEKERQEQLLATQKAHLDALQQVQDELVKREALRKELLRHTVNTQEEERAHIARELHDETAQVLTAFSLDLATLGSLLPDNKQTKKILDRLQDLSRQMSQGIYRLVKDLRPAQLDELGLVPALEYMQDDYRQRMDLIVDLSIEGKPYRLESIIETVCFRVVQEALINIVRHAKTNKALILLRFEIDQLYLTIQDHGIGFDVDSSSSRKNRWGIAGMRERVQSVYGDFNLYSRPGEGTRIEIVIPISESDNPTDRG